jgi:hypothetical protein
MVPLVPVVTVSCDGSTVLPDVTPVTLNESDELTPEAYVLPEIAELERLHFRARDTVVPFGIVSELSREKIEAAEEDIVLTTLEPVLSAVDALNN